MKNSVTSFLLFTFFSLQATAQDKYVYKVDLTQVTDDKLAVQLTVPRINKSTIVFHFPKIIPGTYRISDYGKFISEVQAMDKSGKACGRFIFKKSFAIVG